MNIIILGTRGEIESSAPYHSKHSGVLIDDTLLLDCGQKSFLEYNPRAILITHLHPDHAYFVRAGEHDRIECPLYAPESFKEQSIHVTKPLRSFSIKGYIITPIPTIHSLKVKSNAYIIEHKGIKLVYTGDMVWIKKRYHHMLHNTDVVIAEASYMRRGGLVRRDPETGRIYGHTGVLNLMALFSPMCHTIVFTHFGSWFYKDMHKARRQFERLAREYDVDIIVGYDGLELEVE